MEYFNPVLMLILLSEICLGISAWRSPRFLRRAAAHLLTRADVLDVSRAESERRMKVWMAELGVNDKPREARDSDAAPIHRFSPDEVEAS